MRAPSAKITRRFLIGIIVVILGSVLFNYIQTWRERANTVRKIVKILPAELKRSAEIFEHVENFDGVPRYRIYAKRLRDKHSGISILEEIVVNDFNRDGSIRNEIRSQDAEYDQNRRIVHFKGNVRLFIRKNLELRTDSLHYDLNSEIGETSDRMQILSEQISGTAQGVRFDQKQQSLALNSDVDLVLRQIRNGEPQQLHATSDRAFCSDLNDRILLEGRARVDSGVQALSGEKIEAVLDPEEKRITSLIAEGKALYRSQDMGDTRLLGGNRIEFGIKPAGVLEKITVLGDGVFSSGSPSGEDILRGGEIVLQFDEKELPVRVQARNATSLQTRRDGKSILASGEQLVAEFAPGTRDLKKVHISHKAGMLVEQTANSEGSELRADEIDMSIRQLAGRSIPEKLIAQGNARYVSKPVRSGAKPSAERSLSASRLELYQNGSGNFFESGRASGNVIITEDEPGRATRPQLKTLLAENALFTFFKDSSRIRELDADKNVRITYEKPGTSGGLERFKTASDSMKAVFDSKGDLRTVAQQGHFAYSDGSRSASADRCDYEAGKEVLTLTGGVPKMSDDATSTTGKRIEYDRVNKLLVVRGTVRSVLLTQKGTAGFLGSSSASSSAGIITAQEMRYWTETGLVRYSGNVQSRSENQQLQTDRLEITNKLEKVEAEGTVRHTIVRQNSQKGKTNNPKSILAPDLLTTVRSLTMKYSKEQNKIVYSGKVRLLSKDMDLSSDRLDAIPDADGRGVRSVHADGNVFVQSESRKFKGDSADYDTEAERFVIVGNPAEVDDPGKGRSSGRQLTYSRTDDTILLENKVLK